MEKETVQLIFQYGWLLLFSGVMLVIFWQFGWSKKRPYLSRPPRQEEDSTTYLTPIPKPGSFFTEAKKELLEIKKLLNTFHIALIVNSLKRIGKTALAKRFVADEAKEYDHVGWLTYDQSLRHTLVSGLAGYFDVPVQDEEKACQQILILLQNMKGQNLLVIDSYDQPDEDDCLDDLPTNFQILITCREKVDGIPEYFLETLDLDEAREMFLQLAPNQPHTEELNHLLKLIGGHSLMVEKVAKTIHVSPHYDAEKLLTVFEEKKPPAITAESDKKQNAQDYLNKLYVIDKVDKKGLKVLQWFSVLPTTDLPYEMLVRMFGIKDEIHEVFKNTLETLVDQGWLRRKNDSYRCHQLIREYILFSHPFSVGECQNIIKYLTEEGVRLYHADPVQAMEIVPFAESVLEHFKTAKDENLGILANDLATILQATGNFSKAKAYAELALDVRGGVSEDGHYGLATSYNNLAMIYKSMGDFKSAKAYVKKAIIILENLFPEGHHHLDVARENHRRIVKKMEEEELYPHA